MILILILDGTAKIQSLGWERGWPLCGPAAPYTSLLGCSSSFGILRKQAAFLQDGDHVCHHGFPEIAVLWEGQEGCVFGGEGQKKERMFNFHRELHGPQIAPRGQKNLKLFRFFLECLFEEEFLSTLSHLTPRTVTPRAFKGWLPFAVELSVL